VVGVLIGERVREDPVRVIRRPGRRAAVLTGAITVAAILGGGRSAGQQRPSGASSRARQTLAQTHGQRAIAASLRVPGQLRAGAWPGATQAGFSFTVLKSVFCTASSNCWAVGERGGFGQHGRTQPGAALERLATACASAVSPLWSVTAGPLMGLNCDFRRQSPRAPDMGPLAP
jgi:hypothetical protein